MARQLTGTPYPVKGGYGIRWTEPDGTKPRHCPTPPFKTKTAAREWFRTEQLDRIRRHAPSPDVTFDQFAELFLTRHNGAPSTTATLRDRLKPARAKFGSWTLAELEGAAGDIAAWRAQLPEGSRYRFTSALRQTLEAAKRWRYIQTNPAVDAGANPRIRAAEIRPFTQAELDQLVDELDPVNAALVIFAAETGLRTEEWVALERRDIDRDKDAVAVTRKFAKGRLTAYPKTARSRRRVPLSARAVDALEALPPRIDTPLLFPAAEGGHIALDNWRSRVWYPALGFAGLAKCGPYHLRHYFATEALAAGISIFQLERLMGTSADLISRTYGHLAQDTPAHVRGLLDTRGQRKDHEKTTGTADD